MNPIFLAPPSNSVYISDPDGAHVLGQSPYGVYGIQKWMYAAKYQSEFLFTDPLAIQCHVQYYGGEFMQPALYVCDYYNPNLGAYHCVGAATNNTTVGASALLNNQPYLKGMQIIAGNNYQDPNSGATTPLMTGMWSFSFSNLGIATRGTYYLLLVNNVYNGTGFTAKNYFSEPIFVTDCLPNTLLFQSQFNTNKSGNINTVVTGWSNNAQRGTGIPNIPYIPTFLVRCKGYILDEAPKAVLVGYLQQLYQQVQTYGQLVRMKTLKVGELSNGIPPHMLEAITSHILADNYWINGYNYISFNSSNSTVPIDVWKAKRANDAYPLFTASAGIMERFQSQSVITVTAAPGEGNYYAPGYYAPGYYA